MKVWEYAIVRGISKLFEGIQKEDERQERQRKKSGERKLDKGSWVYNPLVEIYDFVPCKKNLHYVTEQEDGDTLTVTLSKKPLSLDSIQFDYPWDAEDYCEFYSTPMYQNTNIDFKRAAPILIADNDAACPFCKNSRPAANWIRNTLKQELQEIPVDVADSLRGEDLKLGDFPLRHYWCPICCCRVEPEYLMQKGEEWKMQFIENLEVNRVSPLREKILRDEERKERERPRTLKEKLNNDARPLLQFDPGLITPESHQGLMAKVVCHVITKDKEIYKAKWIKACNGLPEADTLDPKVTSYFHYDKERLELERRLRVLLPVRYVPLPEIDRDISRHYKRNDNKVEEFTKSYHKGEPLPIIKLYYTGEVLNDDLEILEFACDMGFTHVPAIFFGNIDKKEEMERRFIEVTIIPR